MGGGGCVGVCVCVWGGGRTEELVRERDRELRDGAGAGGAGRALARQGGRAPPVQGRVDLPPLAGGGEGAARLVQLGLVGAGLRFLLEGTQHEVTRAI